MLAFRSVPHQGTETRKMLLILHCTHEGRWVWSRVEHPPSFWEAGTGVHTLSQGEHWGFLWLRGAGPHLEAG